MGRWKLILWMISWLARPRTNPAPTEAGTILAGDRDRERAALALREHFARGYLTLDELSHRTGRVLAARSHAELRGALAGLSRGPLWALPALVRGPALVARGQTLFRRAVLVFFTGAYVLFSLGLVLVFALALVLNGASPSVLVPFLLIWLVPTYLLARLWRRLPR